MNDSLKMSRPTPETDGQPRSIGIGCGGTYSMVNAEFARKMERERDEAREEIEFLKKTPLKQRCQQLEREINHWCDMHTIASKQRDEAREQNAYLRCIAERAIHYLDQSYRDGFSNKASELRYKLKQLKEGAK